MESITNFQKEEDEPKKEKTRLKDASNKVKLYSRSDESKADAAAAVDSEPIVHSYTWAWHLSYMDQVGLKVLEIL